MAVPNGFWTGANMFFDDREKQRLAADKFLAEQLTLTKSIVLPELIKRLDRQRTKREESKLRIEQAQILQLSKRSALALERSGQLKITLERVNDLLKQEKLDPEYIDLLDAYVSTKIDNDEDLAAAIAQGLDSNSFVTEAEQMEGLLLAMHSTDEEDFSKAVELLQPAPSSVSPLPLFDIAVTKGKIISSDDRRNTYNELGRALAGTLNTRLIESTTSGGKEWVNFKEPNVSGLLSEMVDSVLDFNQDVSTNLSKNTLAELADDLIKGIQPALINTQGNNNFGGVIFNLPWAQKNFAAAYRDKIANPDLDNEDIWKPYVSNSLNTPAGGPDGGSGGPAGGSGGPAGLTLGLPTTGDNIGNSF